MNNENTQVNTEKTASSATVSRRAAIQRGLRKGGMVAAPVLMTTLGRSAMAGGGVQGAKTPSGFCSINASRPSSLTCTGLTPTTWCNKQAVQWPNGCAPSDQFSKYFGSSSLNGKTMKQVLAGAGIAGSTDMQVGGYCAAAYLNCAAGLTPVIQKTDTVKMWNGHYSGNGYKPVPNATWRGSTICYYLSNQTMG